MTVALLLLLLLDPAAASAGAAHPCQRAAESALRADSGLRHDFWRIRVEPVGSTVESDPAGGDAVSGRATLWRHDGEEVRRGFACEFDEAGQPARFALGR